MKRRCTQKSPLPVWPMAYQLFASSQSAFASSPWGSRLGFGLRLWFELCLRFRIMLSIGITRITLTSSLYRRITTSFIVSETASVIKVRVWLALAVCALLAVWVFIMLSVRTTLTLLHYSIASRKILRVWLALVVWAMLAVWVFIMLLVRTTLTGSCS